MMTPFFLKHFDVKLNWSVIKDTFYEQYIHSVLNKIMCYREFCYCNECRCKEGRLAKCETEITSMESYQLPSLCRTDLCLKPISIFCNLHSKMAPSAITKQSTEHDSISITIEWILIRFVSK